MTKIYVGNLPFSATEASIEAIFATAGSVTSVKIITDRETSRSKGFGFVEMSSTEEMNNAIKTLNGADNGGRPMTVSEAKPQAPRDSSSRGGFGSSNRSSGGGSSFGRNRY